MISSAPVAFILSSFFGLSAAKERGPRKTKPPLASRQQGFRNVRFSSPSGRDGLGHDHYDHAYDERARHRIDDVVDGVHRVKDVTRNAGPMQGERLDFSKTPRGGLHGHAELALSHQRLDRMIAGHLADVARGTLRVVDRRYPLAEAAAAHVESREAFGRVLLVP
jgi:hypothetical protein